MNKKKFLKPGDIVEVDKEKGINFVVLCNRSKKYNNNNRTKTYVFMCANCGCMLTYDSVNSMIKKQQNKISISKDLNSYCELHSLSGPQVIKLLWQKKKENSNYDRE